MLRHLSLKNRFALLLLVVLTVLVGIYLLQVRMVSTAQKEWSQLRNNTLAREELITRISEHLGYGAMIHNFKNYVLRGADKHYQRVDSYYSMIQQDLDTYRALEDIDKAELEALKAIATVAAEYRQAADMVKKMTGEGALPKQIDKAVKISDKPAIEGIETLNKSYLARVDIATGSFEQLLQDSSTKMGVALAIVLLIICGSLWMIYRYITGRIGTMHQALHNLASGEGDLSRKIELQGRDEFHQLAEEFNSFIANLAELVRAITGLSGQIGQGMDGIDQNSSHSLQRSRSQMSETDSLSQAVDGLTDTAHQVVENTANAVEAVNHAQVEFDRGVIALSNSVNGIQALASELDNAGQTVTLLKQQSDAIGEIINVIGSIAEQTNLLALNAAIEAARAGEQGRGFAVVADEVRTLAGRTQESTEQIRRMIEQLQSGTEQAVVAMQASASKSGSTVEDVQRAEASMAEIKDEIQRISTLNQQIASASEAQSNVADELRGSIGKIADLSRETVGSIDDNQQSIGQLHQHSQQMSRLVGRFKV